MLIQICLANSVYNSTALSQSYLFNFGSPTNVERCTEILLIAPVSSLKALY